MIKVPVQPRIWRYGGSVNLPIIFRLLAMSIMKHITGAAVIPLIIAAHTRAWIGSIFEKLSNNPIRVASARTA